MKDCLHVNLEHVRIVCANVHNESGEIEIILELNQAVKGQPFPERKYTSLWIDKAEVLKRSV